jgi:hypothetical protein
MINNIAVLTISAKTMKTFLASFYANEKDKVEKFKTTVLHLFIDNRNIDFESLHSVLEEYHDKYCKDLQIIYYKDLDKQLIRSLSLTNQDSLDYIRHQTHHIKLSIPLILHEKGINRFFFVDDDTVFLKSPEKYLESESEFLVYYDLFPKYYHATEQAKQEFSAFSKLCQTELATIEDFNASHGLINAGQIVFTYFEDYKQFLYNFYTNKFILQRFFDNVYNRTIQKVVTKSRFHKSYFDEQKALSYYFIDHKLAKFDKDVHIYFYSAQKFIARKLEQKNHSEFMFIHYATKEKDFYIDHFYNLFYKGQTNEA